MLPFFWLPFSKKLTFETAEKMTACHCEREHQTEKHTMYIGQPVEEVEKDAPWTPSNFGSHDRPRMTKPAKLADGVVRR